MTINFTDLVTLGKDAETRFTGAGKAVTGFSAAVDSGFGDNKKTIWLDCSIWGERGEKIAEYLVKGSRHLIQGELGTREYEGKTYITVDVKEVKLGGKSGQSDRQAKPKESKPAHADASNGFADDETIPFAPIPLRQLW
jgi:single-strand DNA-binding protein